MRSLDCSPETCRSPEPRQTSFDNSFCGSFYLATDFDFPFGNSRNRWIPVGATENPTDSKGAIKDVAVVALNWLCWPRIRLRQCHEAGLRASANTDTASGLMLPSEAGPYRFTIRIRLSEDNGESTVTPPTSARCGTCSSRGCTHLGPADARTSAPCGRLARGAAS